MEEKLFWVGILVGIHFFLTQHFRDTNKFVGKAAFTRLWHAVFMALLGFVGGALLSVSLDNRSGEVVAAVLFSARQFAWGVAAAVVLGFYAFFKGDKTRYQGKGSGKPQSGVTPASDSAKGARVTAVKKGSENENLPPAIKEDLEWSETVFSAVLLASVVMYLFVQAFKIPSGSMRTTFLEGDHLFVNKFVYGFRVPYTHKKFLALKKIKRGDIVIFQFPSRDPDEFQCGGRQYGKDFIKRVIGLPGDRVELKDGKVSVNGVPLKEEAYVKYLDDFRYPADKSKVPPGDYQVYWEKRMLGKMFAEYIKDNFGPVIVPQGHYMMMGDNRDRSCDSRYWGPVPEYLIKGKAMVIYWPPSRMGFPE
ncbi:MAG: signal peptidase I [Elusimicrobia bacterium]|nr:signal peptidase I [Elusimicrobiota bacterium]